MRATMPRATKPAKVGLQLLAVPCLFSSCVAMGGESMVLAAFLMITGVGLLAAGSPKRREQR